MKKLHLEKVEVFKEYKNPTAGGYVIGIYSVEDVSDKEYLKLSYDIVEGEFKGYYSNLVKEGVYKALPIMFMSYADSEEDRNIKRFKGTVTAFEKSNNGFKWKDNEQDLKGKKIGVVMRDEEYEKKDGSVGSSLKVYQTHSIERIKDGDFKIPEPKKLAQTSKTTDSPFGKKTEDKKEENLFGAEESNPFDNKTEVEEVADMPFDEEENPFA